MKLNKLFLGAIAALASVAMVACSDDAPDVNNGGEKGEGNASFVTVNIVNPAATASRADGGYVNGDGPENAVNSALFLLFNTDGNQAVEPIEITDLSWTPISTGDYVERISSVDLIINGEHGKVYPSRLLCILNAPANMKTELKTKRLSEITGTNNLRGTYSVYGTGTGTTPGNGVDFTTGTVSDGSFIMTNSVYNDNGKTITVQNIEGKVMESPEEAKQQPVTVHVERIVAKVTTSAAENFSNDGTSTNVDGKDIKLKPEIKGVHVANVAKSSYLFKNLSLNYQINGVWNEASLYRSFWETTPADLQFSNFSLAETQGIAWNENHAFYIQPNTGNTKTAVLITAQLKDEDDNAVELVKWGGNYFTVDGYKGQIVNQLNGAGYRKKVGESYESLDVDDIFGTEDTDWEWQGKTSDNGFKAYEASFVIKSLPYTGTIYMHNGTNADGTNHYDEVDVTAALTDINAKLASNRYRAQYWKEGYCYYFKNINHLFGLEGIVRNHVYALNLTGVVGLGTPVVDITDPIIPENPDENATYLAAQVRILSWRIVSQDVNFGE